MPVIPAVGSVFTVTTLLAVAVQPLVPVTVTVYVPPVVKLPDKATAELLLQAYVPPPVAVKVTLPPAQKVVAPPAVIPAAVELSVTGIVYVELQELALVKARLKL